MLVLMAINTYDDTKIRKGGIWVNITKASCIMSFKSRHDRARLNSICVACDNLLVYHIFQNLFVQNTRQKDMDNLLFKK